MSCCVSRVDGAAPGGGVGSDVVLQGILVDTVVAVTATGSTEILVLQFTGASTQIGTPALATWVTRADSATVGTTFTITQPGVYAAQLDVPWASGQTVGTAVSLDAPLALRDGTTSPLTIEPSVYASNFKFSTTIQSGDTNCILTITQTQIDAGENIVRAEVYTPGAPGTVVPAAAYINVAEVSFRLFRMGTTA